jgi:hypothetical protein
VLELCDSIALCHLFFHTVMAGFLFKDAVSGWGRTGTFWQVPVPQYRIPLLTPFESHPCTSRFVPHGCLSCSDHLVEYRAD